MRRPSVRVGHITKGRGYIRLPLLGTKTSVLSERNPSQAWVFSFSGTSFGTAFGTTSSNSGCETSGSDGRFYLRVGMLGGKVSSWMIRCRPLEAMGHPDDKAAPLIRTHLGEVWVRRGEGKVGHEADSLPIDDYADLADSGGGQGVQPDYRNRRPDDIGSKK